ncbi:hypothetical protein Hsw_2670 [Hymenobacter swuensis DY53]|uniref:Uncharacterized protein n=1 Tax=Hymenobacter swuensis DY53 TaxID=1227739 RepID=W8F961_9BACT|nr:hypothetical protein Hsw_2670 [Hymenobacter swuensis DY53]
MYCTATRHREEEDIAIEALKTLFQEYPAYKVREVYGKTEQAPLLLFRAVSQEKQK